MVTQTNPYCGPAPLPGTLLGDWNFDPVLLAVLAVGGALGLRLAPNRSAFALGWCVVVLAFVSPLCALTTALFSARSLHHILLVSVAAPLLAMAVPLRGPRGSLGFVLLAVVLVLWHWPPVYRAAWDSVAIYWLLQIALLGSAWGFWSGLLDAGRGDANALMAHGLLIGALAGVMGLIGAVLTFAPMLLYPEHLAGPAAWGLSPIADQQLAGLIMWVPGMVPLAALAAHRLQKAWRQIEAAA